MDKKFGYYIFGGLLLGAFLGWMWSASNNPLVGMGIGAFFGAGIGWFIAAAVFEKRDEKEKNK